MHRNSHTHGHSHSHGHSQTHTHGHPPTGATVIVTSPPVVTPHQPPIAPFNPLSYSGNPHGFHYHVPQQHQTHGHGQSATHSHSHPPSGF